MQMKNRGGLRFIAAAAEYRPGVGCNEGKTEVSEFPFDAYFSLI